MHDQDQKTSSLGAPPRRMVARWVCWATAFLIFVVSVIFTLQNWAGAIQPPPAAHSYLMLFVLLLAGAGHVIGDERGHLLRELRERPCVTEERLKEITSDAYAAGYADALAQRPGSMDDSPPRI